MKLRRAFTLIELLVVIAIIAVLVGLLVVAVQRLRSSGMEVECKNNLRQIGIGCHSFHDRQRTFPPGYESFVASDGSGLGPGWCWAAYLLPDLEQGNLFRGIDLSLDVVDPANAAASKTPLQVFRCPADDQTGDFAVMDDNGQVLGRVALANYVAMSGNHEINDYPGTNNGVFVRNRRFRIAEVTDGLSSTILVGERTSKVSLATWSGVVEGAVVPNRLSTTPPNLAQALVLSHTGILGQNLLLPNGEDTAADCFRSDHVGVHFLLGDGSVRMVLPGIAPLTWMALGSRAGREVVGDY